MTEQPKRLKELIKWSLPSLGLGATGYFLFQSKWTEAIISSAVTAGSSLWAKFSEGFMEEMEAGVNERGKKTAKFVLTQGDKLPEQLRWKLSNFQSKYYASLSDKYLKLKTEGFNVAEITPNLGDVFVPLKVNTKSPGQVSSGLTSQNQPTGRTENLQIWNFLGKNSDQRRIAILAPPGSGKTTLLQYITLIYAQKAHRKHTKSNFIPVFLRLRDVREQLVKPQPPNLNALIEAEIKKLPVPGNNPLPDWFNQRLSKGQCLVMLDGLDEVTNQEERSIISQWVNQQMGEHPKATFILTSRPHGYESEILSRVDIVLEVQPFNLAEMKNFIQGWYLQTEINRQQRDKPAVRQDAQTKANDLIEALLQNPAISKMASNPLLVTMIATVHNLLESKDLPKRRVQLYKEICDVLLGKRLTVKKIKLDLDAEQNQSLLQMIALDLMQRGTQKFTVADVSHMIEEKLAQTANNTLTVKQWLESIRNEVALLVERELGSYEFAHLTFQEYLAAVQIHILKQEVYYS
ncbi:NACHT domain-containing protein [Nodularia sp. NIES-3585]|uniref:NACHT domain-containing protein n=1 Tax=Nodularia sp. NIES-3585 TaxID=1973477 RepID=UPI000B5C4241|nr:NACHT domain-containing protein [Nodularia sp. NIES-3585]GAX36297.1 hypothetical protein NIES3585_23230 [Nodularia sp. NIES-3585]